MPFWKSVRGFAQKVAEALDPRNFLEMLETAFEDLRVSLSKSGRTAGRSWQVLLLCLVCGMLLCALCVKWVFRAFQRLGTIIIGAVAYHGRLLRRSASRMHAAWVELSEGLVSKAWQLWDQLRGTTSADRVNKYVGMYDKLWGEVLQSTPCCIARGIEAGIAWIWLGTASSGVVYTLALRRSHPGLLAAAFAFLVLPPLAQEGLLSLAQRQARARGGAPRPPDGAFRAP